MDHRYQNPPDKVKVAISNTLISLCKEGILFTDPQHVYIDPHCPTSSARLIISSKLIEDAEAIIIGVNWTTLDFVECYTDIKTAKEEFVNLRRYDILKSHGPQIKQRKTMYV